MRIITLCQKQTFGLLFFLFVVFYNGSAYAQCPTVTNTNQTFCDLQLPKVVNLQATNNGGGVKWYSTATSTTPLADTEALVNGEDYFADDNTGTCGVRQSVFVTIYGAPTGQNFQGVCVEKAKDATISDLVAVGNNVQWYDTSASTTPLSGTTQLVDNKPYYASQTNPITGCETSRLVVLVRVGIVPVPTGDAVQEFCNISGTTPTVADLVASGNNNWYDSPFSPYPLTLSTPLEDGRKYYATTVDFPCESSSRFEVLVNINEQNNAGTNGSRQICESEIASTPNFNLFNLLGGNPDISGTWSGPLPTSNGHLGRLDVSGMTLAGSPYVFTYTVSSSSCPTVTANVTITILPSPDASVSVNTTTICSGDTSVLTFSGTPNATVTYNINGGGNQAITLNGAGTATLNGNYTVNTTVNLVSVATAVPSCTKALNQTLTITVIDPTASISANPSTLCNGGATMLTFTGTPNATVDYNIDGVVFQSVTLDVTGSYILNSTFTSDTTFNLTKVTTAGAPSCFKVLNQSVLISMVDPTADVTADPATVCSGDVSALLFTGTPNSIVTYNIDGGTNQTVSLDGAGIATVNNTYSENTTINLVKVETTGNPVCSKVLTQSVTISVVEPTASVSATPSSVCNGNATTLTFTGTPNAEVTYKINGGLDQIITLDTAGSAILNGNYTVDTTVSLISIMTTDSPSCTRPLNQNLTITVIDPTASVSANPTTICSGDASLLTFTGTPNAMVTYSINGGTNQTVNLDGTGTATINNTFITNSTVNLVSVETTVGSPCIKALNQNLSITVIDPTASVSATPTTVCSAGATTLNFTGTPNATITYNINGGGNQTITLNGAGTATLNGNYIVNTTVSLVSVSTVAPTCTKALNQTLTITVIEPTASISANPSTLCMGGAIILDFTGTPNATVDYNIDGVVFQSITLDAAGSATFTSTFTSDATFNLMKVTTAGVPSCFKVLTQSLVVSIIDPTADVMADPSTVCSGDISALIFTGTPNSTVTYNINGGTNQTVSLDGAGTATVNSAYSVNTTVNLVKVETTGNPVCSKVLTQSVTISVVEPTASVSATPSIICKGDASALTFTGTPNAEVTYKINGGLDQIIVLDAAGNAILNGNYSVDTTVSLISIMTTDSPSCTKPLNQNLTITAVDPTASVSANPTTVCAGSTTVLTFTGTPNATVIYTIDGGANQTVILNGTGTGSVNTLCITDTVVNLVSVTTSGVPSCTTALNQNFTIPVVNPTASVSATPMTICSGDSTILTFTGTPNAVVTYTIDGGANTIITLDAAGTAVLNGTYSANTVVHLVSVATVAPACSKTLTQNLTITVVEPFASVSADQPTICSGGTSIITFTGTPNAVVTYKINGGTNQTITLDAAGSAPLNGNYTVDTTITLISVETTGIPVCSAALSQSITISVITPPNAGTSPAPVDLCVSSASIDLFPLLGAGAETGGTWSPAMASGTGVFDPAVDVSGTYTYTVTGTNPCPSASASVQVSVKPLPDAGTDGALGICSNQNPVDLFNSLGGTPQTGGVWSPALASGTGMFNPAVDAGGVYTYKITGIAPCADDTAIVTVTVTPGQEAGTDNVLSVCLNSASQDLFLLLGAGAQPGGTWSPVLASGTSMFNPAVDTAGDYTYTLSGPNPCDNDNAIILVTVNPIPDAGIGNPVTVCSNSGSVDLFTSLSGTPQTGGTWSPALASGTGVFDPGVDTAQTYTYNVGGGLCPIATATVDVSVIQAANSGGAGQTLTSCVSETLLDLFTGLDGSQGVGTWSDDDVTNALINNIFNPSLVAAGTYHFTYTVAGTSPCANASSLVTVVVDPIPNAGTFTGLASVCNSAGTIDLNTLLTAQQTTGVWLDSASQPVTMPLDISVFLPGLYDYKYSVTTACGNDQENVQFNLLAKPMLDIPNITIPAICKGTDATINLTGMTDGNYKVDYDLSGSNVLTGQQSTFAIAAGVGSFVIPTASIPNEGITDISFLNIVNTDSNCSNTLSAVTAQITIISSPDIDDTNLDIPAICHGNDVVVNIMNAASLPDGVYQFAYNITGDLTASGNSGDVTIAGGSGLFIIPAVTFTAAGNFTLTVTAITSTMVCQNTTETATANFMTSMVPDISGGAVSAGKTCLTYDVDIVISGATALQDGDYTLTYALSGSNVYAATEIVTFANGETQFTIPATAITNVGDTFITVNQLTFGTTTCGISGIVFTPFTFSVLDADYCAEVVIPDGFSPNDDTINDTFEIRNLASLYPNFKLEIYNRYGNLVFEGNKDKPAWDGSNHSNGAKLGNGVLPNGVYFYILNFNDGVKDSRQGRLYLNR